MAQLAEWIPRPFIELYQQGRFDYWGAPYHKLTEGEREERLRTRRSRVLWWPRVIEWDRTPEEVSAFAGDEQLRPGLFPFAGDGMGGQYCWYPKWKHAQDSEPPVIFVPREDVEVRAFARDFAECLVRCIILDVVMSEEERSQATWDAHVAIMAPYLHRDQLELLGALRRDLSPRRCADADEALENAIGPRTLMPVQLPTKYEIDEREVGAEVVS